MSIKISLLEIQFPLAKKSLIYIIEISTFPKIVY